MYNQFRSAQKQIDKLKKQTQIREHQKSVKDKNRNSIIGTTITLDFRRTETDKPILIEVAVIPQRSYWKHK